MLGLVVVVPAAVGLLHISGTFGTVLSMVRWPIMLVAVLVALSALYHFAPSRSRPRWQWVSWGSIVATVLWLLVSAGFSIYVQNFGNYNKVYGSVGALVVLLMWFYISAYAVLLGAELNAEMEHQTKVDTTVGRSKADGRTPCIRSRYCRGEPMTTDSELATGVSAGRGNSGKLMRMLRWIGSRELSVLIVLFALMGAVWGFVEISDAVVEGGTKSFDHTVLLAMRNPTDLSDPIGPSWVEEMGRDFTALGSVGVLAMVTLAVVGYLLLDGKRRIALVVVVATLGALAASTVLKTGFDRPRPELVPHGMHVYTASFPSGHSMLSASTYLTLGALLARVQRRRRIKAYILLVAIFATLVVGISRVYLGVHWPTDVLGGWTAGAGWALMCWLLARWLQRHGQVEESGEETDGAPAGP